MADLVASFNTTLAHPGADDLAEWRANWRWLTMVMLEAVKVAPEWTTTITSSSSPLDYSQPDHMIVSKTFTDVSPNVTERFKYVYTFSSGNKTQILFQYDDGTGSSPEFTTVTGGQIDLVYDGSGNLISAASS